MKKNLFFLFFFSFITLVFSQTVPPKNTRTFPPTLFADYPGFIKHLNGNKSETYYASFDYNMTQIVKKFGSDGLLKWKVSITNGQNNDLSLTQHNLSIDKDDNIILCFSPNGVSGNFFNDATGISIDLSINAYTKVVLKIDKNGNLIWKRNFAYTYNGHRASIYTDNSSDIYLISLNQTSENSMGIDHLLISKLDGNTGNTIYSKDFRDLQIYSAFSLFDVNDNLYLFLDANFSGVYNFDNIPITSNFGGNNVFLKFDKEGNTIVGKNFYTNNTSLYSILSDGVFDGENISLIGYLTGMNTGDYTGLNNTIIPRKYPNVYSQGLLAKIDLSGNVIWQKPLYSNVSLDKGVWTNINVDSDKNIYSYFHVKNKLSINNSEYQFNVTDGNKIISKFDNLGNVLYLNPVDIKRDVTNNPHGSTMIDVIANDVYNCFGVTSNSYFLNYPLNDIFIPKSYIATFGNLDTKYLTPESNYLQLSNVEIANNSDNANTFSFNLVNNVNWNAISDQNWLNLSYVKLAQRIAPTNTISDNGDAKIIMTAETNNSGIGRTANIMLSGDGGVSPKTIAVTQSGFLATGETKTFVTTLYPNPTSDILNIETQQKISKIEIFDMSGKLLKTENGKDKKVSVSQLTKGMYLIKLYTENGVVNSKFIKN